MTKEKNLWVEICVTVQDDQYNYRSTREGKATMLFTLNRDLLESLHSDPIIAGQIRAALTEFDNCEVPDQEEKDGKEV